MSVVTQVLLGKLNFAAHFHSLAVHFFFLFFFFNCFATSSPISSFQPPSRPNLCLLQLVLIAQLNYTHIAWCVHIFYTYLNLHLNFDVMQLCGMCLMLVGQEQKCSCRYYTFCFLLFVLAPCIPSYVCHLCKQHCVGFSRFCFVS